MKTFVIKNDFVCSSLPLCRIECIECSRKRFHGIYRDADLLSANGPKYA